MPASSIICFNVCVLSIVYMFHYLLFYQCMLRCVPYPHCQCYTACIFSTTARFPSESFPPRLCSIVFSVSLFHCPISAVYVLQWTLPYLCIMYHCVTSPLPGLCSIMSVFHSLSMSASLCTFQCLSEDSHFSRTHDLLCLRFIQPLCRLWRSLCLWLLFVAHIALR